MHGTDPSDGQSATAGIPADASAGAAMTSDADPEHGSTGPGGAGAPVEEILVREAESRAPRPVPVTVWRRVDAEVSEAFDQVVPVDLASVFTGYGPLPAVVGCDGAAGTWGEAVGQSRTVILADGGRLEETIVEVARPGLFRYEVVPTHGALRLVVRRIEGRFVFSRSEAGGTVIRWTYVFRPRRGAHSAVRALAPVWRRYADEVMGRLAEVVIAGAPDQGPRASAD